MPETDDVILLRAGVFEHGLAVALDVDVADTFRHGHVRRDNRPTLGEIKFDRATLILVRVLPDIRLNTPGSRPQSLDSDDWIYMSKISVCGPQIRMAQNVLNDVHRRTFGSQFRCQGMT